MLPAAIGAAAVGAGANLLGGWLGSQAQEDARAQNAMMQTVFAKNGIRWRVEDARAAGIHPLYALGASTQSFAPSSVGGDPFAQSISAAGQDISRAINATRPLEERQETLLNLSVERAGLQNDLLRSQIAKINSSMNPPGPTGSGFNIPGQPDSGISPDGSFFKNKPPDVVPGAPSQPSSENFSHSDIGYARTTTGWAPVPSKDVKERIEDNLIHETFHAFRNNILPTFGQNLAPPPFPAPNGQNWWWNTGKQEYQLWRDGDRPTAGHLVPTPFKHRWP